MSDKPVTPDPQYNALAPSYSIEVPIPAVGAVPASATYLRVGAPDLTSKVERGYYQVNPGTDFASKNANIAAWNALNPGIIMWSSSDILKVAKSTTSFTVSEETLKVVNDPNVIVSVAYTFKDAIGFRDVGYKISESTSWSLGTSQSWKVATSSDFSLSIDQKVSFGASLGAKASIDVGAALGIMDIKSAWDSLEVKTKSYGDYAVKKKSALSGSDSVSLSVSPIADLFNVTLERANNVFAVLLGVIGGLGALTLVGLPAGGAIAVAATKEKEKVLKDWSAGIAYVGSAEMGLLSVCQAAYLVLGTAALAVSKKWVPKVGTGIVMDGTSIKLTTPTNSMTLDLLGITLENGLTNIKMNLMGTEVNGPSFDAMTTTSRMAIDTGGVFIQGPSVRLSSASVIRVTAPTVSFSP
jgi:hypothetical protein